jgi:hypothetical protein
MATGSPSVISKGSHLLRGTVFTTTGVILVIVVGSSVFKDENKLTGLIVFLEV